MKSRDKEAAFIMEYNSIEDWMFQFDYLVMRAMELKPLDKEELTKDRLIRGCQSKVWILVECRDGRVYFRGECYSLLIKGVIASMLSFLEGQSIEEVIAYEPLFLEKTNLGSKMSIDRNAGVRAVLDQIKKQLEY